MSLEPIRPIGRLPKRALQASVALEREVHARVQQLTMCGVRPKVIFQLVGKAMSLSEVRRIHECASPMLPGERHGRNIKFENVHKISALSSSIYIECFKLVNRSLRQCQASQADALCSVWRIIADRYGVPHHLEIANASCEEMIVLYLNYQVGDITIEQCSGCGTQFLQYEANYCATCLSESKKSKAAA